MKPLAGFTRNQIGNRVISPAKETVEGLKNLDNQTRHFNNWMTGEPTTVKDVDPRDNFVSVQTAQGFQDAIISPDPSKQHSVMKRCQEDGATSIQKIWQEDGVKFALEACRADSGEHVAQFSREPPDSFAEVYDADKKTATSLFEEFEQEFEQMWNLAQ